MNMLRTWARDLVMGVRFAVAGGRGGWVRTLLTGVGVGLGVALLLGTTGLPNALAARDARGAARDTITSPTADAPGRNTLLTARGNMNYHSADVSGRLVEPEGPDAPLAPGLEKYPGPGELAVSPALDRLLKSDEGKLLRERLDGRITAVIGDAGLTGPGELYYYAGTDRLSKEADSRSVERITAFESDLDSPPLDAVLTLLVLVMFTVLLVPVAVFVAAAVRFGGDRRDQRLAALRLVGADGGMTRRIAAGEALAGSLIGLVLGAGFFLAARRLTPYVSIQDRSLFPEDLAPDGPLALIVAVAVPAAAVLVTLFALRNAIIEPLGVVRSAAPVRRRIWWRLLLPPAGLALLVPMMGRVKNGGPFNGWQVSAGVVLLLIGVIALLPWLLERVVGPLGGAGPVSWQLAVRRLQLTSGTAARLVGGIAVAVAGAIALQMLFAGVEGEYTEQTDHDPVRASLSILKRSGTDERLEALGAAISGAKGVARADALATRAASHGPSGGAEGDTIELTIGTCTALREVAELPSCQDGDAFVLTGAAAGRGRDSGTAAPGEKLLTGNVHAPDGPAPVAWTVPASARPAQARKDPTGRLRSGLLVTPAAAPKSEGGYGSAQVFVQLDPNVPDAMERARTAAYKADPLATVMTLRSTRTAGEFGSIRTGLFIGATLVLVLIGTSLLVSQLEQLRERRRLLAALVAFGTRRSTLGLSVLWQTALPVLLGLALATAVGLTLGAVLMRMTAVPVRIDWASVAAMAGIGGGVVVVVTLVSLPPLLRMVRPDGLRTE
ncbi:ABC transporter permease [Streptomyces sp. BR123]|uniref:ABC transporter permease n=1 Tax=Streptomyces sp. BR123 TaxID=2749828 RepID=UPI0015C43CC3|nr:FtsX-like permease family protein [Streptomyces sp. BR123]NXY93363.1 ABC transporter permease [Streptomyces sp. BR123]